MGRNNCAIALGRKSWLFAGPDSGGRRAAAMYSLIVSALCRARHNELQVCAARGRRTNRVGLNPGAEMIGPTAEPWSFQVMGVTPGG
jgi:hypothetical protein